MDGTDTGWKEVTPIYDGETPRFTGKIYYRKIGNIFILRNTSWIKLSTDLEAGSSRSLGTVPQDERPGGATIGYAYANSSPYPIMAVRLENNLSVYNGSGSSISSSTNVMLQVMTVV